MSATNGEPTRSDSIRVRSARIEDLSRIVAVLLASFYPKIQPTNWFYWLMRIGIREDIKTRLKTDPGRYACLVAASIDSAVAEGISSTISDEEDTAGRTRAGKVIGTVEMSLRPCESWRFFPPQRAYLSNLAVDHNYRRLGAAKQLLHTCENVALQWGFHCLYLHVMADNQAAQALYRQAGFQTCEVSNPVLAGLGLRAERLLLAKHIGQKKTQRAADENFRN